MLILGSFTTSSLVSVLRDVFIEGTLRLSTGGMSAGSIDVKKFSSFICNGKLSTVRDMVVSGTVQHDVTSDQARGFIGTVGGDLTVATSGLFDADSKSTQRRYSQADGNSGSLYASFGGLALEETSTQTNQAYGDFRDPIELGTRALKNNNDNGGGHIGVTVAGNALINGVIQARGFGAGTTPAICALCL